jgi:PTH1 family peptidyl-tRNA hydrolase
MKLIAGLGNPGAEYAWSRHNAGWLALDSVVTRLSLGEPKLKFKGALWGPILHNGEKICLLKPYTYMNLSGLSVQEAVRYYGIENSDTLIIFDDIALPFGKLRMREKGSAGGQKGMISILGALGTLNVPRLRIGVGAPDGPIAMPDWVLGAIPKEQRRVWDKIEDAVWESINLWLAEGIQRAMSFVNGLKIECESEDKE